MWDRTILHALSSALGNSRGHETRSATATAADRGAQCAGSEQSNTAANDTFARKSVFPRVRRGIVVMILGESSRQKICYLAFRGQQVNAHVAIMQMI
jgi:hypothetical protein